MPVNNDTREMPLISKENAEYYCKELLANYSYETKYKYFKIPALKDLMEYHILREATNIEEFKSHCKKEPSGQWKWLFDRKEVISNYETRGYIPQDLVVGIEHLFKARNKATHKQKMTEAEYLGHFNTVAETIEFFSKVLIPKEIQDILDGKSRKGNPNSKRKKNEKDAPLLPKKEKPQSITGLDFISDKEDSLKKLKKDVSECNCQDCLLSPRRVLGNGGIPSKVMFIAQAPGDFLDGKLLVHDETGDNFKKLLKQISWKRESIFITNAVLCHTPKEPTLEQMGNCNDYLKQLINLVNPSVIVTLGGVAFRAINKIEPTKYVFGRNILAIPRNWNKRKLFPLYLPTPRVINTGLFSMKQFEEAFKTLDSIVHPITGLKQKE